MEEKLFNILPLLETERLVLRCILPNDARDIFKYASSKEVTRFLSWEAHKNLEITHEFISAVLKGYADDLPGPWGICLKSDRKVIGSIGFHFWDNLNNCAEVGFVLSKKFWRKRIVSEALDKLIEFGFNRMALNRIEAKCFTENEASQKLLEKLGFFREGCLRENVLTHHGYVNVYIYSCLKKDYINSFAK